MFSTLKNAWNIPELRKKLIFTALIMLLYRIGNVIPVPYINVDALTYYFNTTLSDTILGLYNAMSGSAFAQATVLALSIQPYINSSIIIQLLTIAIPALERLQKDGGEEGTGSADGLGILHDALQVRRRHRYQRQLLGCSGHHPDLYSWFCCGHVAG